MQEGLPERYCLLLQVLAVLTPLAAASALQFQPIRGGVLLLDQKAVFREAAQVEVFVAVDSDEDRRSRREARSILRRSAAHVLDIVQRHDNASIFGKLMIGRLKSYEEDDSKYHEEDDRKYQEEDDRKYRRRRRGLINLVGDLASTLFGTARQEDLDKLSRALGALRDQTKTFIRMDEQRVATIDTLAANQEAIANQVKMTLHDIQGQDVQIRQMGRILQEQAGHLHQVEIRQRMGLLAELLRDDANTLDANDAAVRLRRTTCEAGRLSDAVLPPDVLEALLEDAANTKRLPISWYYRNARTEYMFRVNETLFCKINLPLVSSQLYRGYDVKTYPYSSNASIGAVRIYHDFSVAISTVGDELFFMKDCMGQNPIVCPGDVHFPEGQFECIRGLVNDDIAKQRECEFTYVNASSVDQRIERIDRNRFVGYVQNEKYYYRCTGERPMHGQLSKGPYVIDIDEHCTLDTASFALIGMRARRASYAFKSPVVEILADELVSEIPWKKLSLYAKEVPHLGELKLKSISRTHLEMSKRSDENLGTKSSDMHWWFWIVLVLLIVGLTPLLYKVVTALKNRWGGPLPVPQEKELATPSIEAPQPEPMPEPVFSPLYPVIPIPTNNPETQALNGATE